MGCSASRPLNGRAGIKHKFNAREAAKKATEEYHAQMGQLELGDMLPLQVNSANGISIPPQPKTLDPRLPLNERQLFGIKKSWKAIGRNMGTTGVNMFVKLFETNQELKNQFQKFKDLKDVTDLRLAEGFDEHAMLVMCTLDEAINNLDDVPYVIDMLRKTGHTHKRFPGFAPDNFYKIEEPFLVAVRETLGDKFSFGMEVAYKRIIYFFLDTLVGGFKS